MEKAIKIKGTEDTPAVVLDKEGNKFEISGRSLPEDAVKFYNPIHQWVEEYVKAPNAVTEFRINLEYFNSSSVKQLLGILIKMEQIIKTGNEIKVLWFYNKEDELMETKGKEIKSILDLPFELRVCENTKV